MSYKKAWNTVYQKAPKHKCAYYGFIDEKGEYLNATNNACHAGLKDFKNRVKELKYLLTLVSSQWGNNFNKEDAKPYYEWLITKSPWACAFVVKDVDAVMKKGFILRTNLPHNIIAGACMATRHPWEHAEKVKFWREVVEAGMDGHMAFLLHISLASGEDTFYVHRSGGHIATSTSVIYTDEVKSFKRHLYNGKRKEKALWIKNHRRYSCVDGAFFPKGSERGRGKHTLLIDDVIKKMKESGKSSKGNLFRKNYRANNDKTSWPHSEYKNLIKVCEEYMK